MFKKGFKALKNLGSKKSKKKNAGDGDNTSMASTTEEPTTGKTSSSRGPPSAYAQAKQGGAAGYSPRSQGRRGETSGIPRAVSTPNVQETTPRSAGAGARPKSQMFAASSQPSPAQGGRETSAEDSVLEMMREMKAKKEAERQQAAVTRQDSQPRPTSYRNYKLSDTEIWPEDDNSSMSSLFAPPTRKELTGGGAIGGAAPDDESESGESESEDESGTESELSYQKEPQKTDDHLVSTKLRLKREKEERKKKGLSVSSSSSDSSWGDTSDLLPSPDEKKTAIRGEPSDIEGIDPVGHVIGQTSLSAHSTKVKAESLSAVGRSNPLQPPALGVGLDKDSDTDKWTDSENELDTPRNKKTSIVGTTPTPDHISEEGSGWSESEDNPKGDKSKLPHGDPAAILPSKAKPALQAAATIKSDSEDAWSDADSPRKSESHKPQLQRIKSDATESVWSNNETPRQPSKAATAAGKVKNDEESGWSDPETPRPTNLGTSQLKKLERLKSESESLWSDDEPSKSGTAAVGKQDKPVKQQTILSESESQWSDEDSPRKTPPAFLEPSAKPLDVMRQQSTGSVWSDDDDNEDDIEALAAPKPTESRPAIITSAAGTEVTMPDMKRQQSVESTWSAEGDDDHLQGLSEPEALKNPLSSTYEVKPLSSTYEVKEKIIPHQSAPLQAPPTQSANQRPSSPAPPSEDDSEWSDAEEASPAHQTTSTTPVAVPAAQTQSNVSAVLDLSDVDDSDGDDSDSELPLSTSKPEPKGVDTLVRMGSFRDEIASENVSVKEKLRTLELEKEKVSGDGGKKANTQLTREVEDLQGKLKSISEENQSLTQSKNEAQKTFETRLAESESKMADLCKQNTDLHTENTRIADELATKSKETVSKSVYDDVTNKLKIIIDENERLTKEKDQTSQSNETAVTGLKSDIENLRAENSQLKKDKDDIIEEMSSKNKEMISKTVYDELNSRLKASQTECETQKSKEKELQTQHQKLIQNLQDKSDALEGECESLKLKIETRNNDHERQFRETISSHKEEIDRLNTSHKEEIHHLTETHNRNKTRLEQKVESLEEDSETLRHSLDESIKSHQKLREEITKQSGDSVSRGVYDDCNNQLKELQRLKNQVDVDLSEIKSEKERREQESENRSSTLTKQIFSLQSDNRDLQDKLSKLRLEQTQSHKNLVPLSDYQQVQEEVDTLHQKVLQLESKVSTQEGPIQPQQGPVVSGAMIFGDGLEVRSREIQLRRERAERELQEARERQRLRHNSAGSVSSCGSTPRRCFSPQRRDFQLSASSSDDDGDGGDILSRRGYNGTGSTIAINNVQQKELERMEEKCRQLKKDTSSLQSSVTSLQAENRQLSNQLHSKSDEAADLRVQNDKLQEKLTIRDQEVTLDLNKKLETSLAAQATVGKLSQQIILLESEISRLKDTNGQLEQRLRNVTAELKVKDDLMRAENQGQQSRSILDTEMVQLRTELEQLRARSDAERATYMTALEEKDKEIAAEVEDKESAKAALDEVTRTLWCIKEETNQNYIPLTSHQEALSRAKDEEERAQRELSKLRDKLDSYSKEAVEAKNVCSMQNVLLNQKDGELKDKGRELVNIRRELDGKIDMLTQQNAQLQDAARERSNYHEKLKDEMMMTMSRGKDHPDTDPYKKMYEESARDVRDLEKQKTVSDQVNNRLQSDLYEAKKKLEKAQDEIKEKMKLETNLLLAQSEADQYKKLREEQVREVSRLENKVEQLQRDSDNLRDSRIHPAAFMPSVLNTPQAAPALQQPMYMPPPQSSAGYYNQHDVDGTNQILKDENSRLREQNTELRAEVDRVQRELQSFSVTRDEMDTAMATARLTTDVNDMTREESANEIHLERKHKMVLYKQTKNLRTEVNEKNVKLQEYEKALDKLKNKTMKLKAENGALLARLKERSSSNVSASWDPSTGLTQADLLQQEYKHLQSQLTSTTNDMHSQARKAKARKHDLNYYQTRAEDLEQENNLLNTKLNDCLLMLQAAERTSSDLRMHISELISRLQQYEQMENTADVTLQELRHSHDNQYRTLQREKTRLEDEARSLRRELTNAKVELETSKEKVKVLQSSQSNQVKLSPARKTRSPSLSPSRLSNSGRSNRPYDSSPPKTDYERDRHALYHAAWNVLDQHGLGPPAEERVIANLDRVWKRHASTPRRYL